MNKVVLWMKPHKFLTLLIILIIMVAACQFLPQKINDHSIGYVTGLSTNPEPRQIKIGEQDFWIPKNYLDSWSYSGALLIALLPDFLGMTEKNDTEFSKTVGDKNNRISIHFQKKDKYKNIKHLYIKQREHALFDINKNLYRKGLPQTATVAYENKLQKFSLQYEKPVTKQGEHLAKEMYTEKDANDEVVSFIECTQKKDRVVKTQWCNQLFEHNDYLFEISFRKTFLPEWQSLQEKAIALINRFMVPPPSISK